MDNSSLYTDIQVNTRKVFELHPNLKSFSWTSGAIWNDDWYNNTVTRITVNNDFVFEFENEIVDLKNDCSFKRFDFEKTSIPNYLDKLLYLHISESFQRLKELYNQDQRNYNKAKKEFFDAVEITFSFYDFHWLNIENESEKKPYSTASNIIETYQQIDFVKNPERMNLISFLLKKKIVSSFFQIMDSNSGLQQILVYDFKRFEQIASSFFRKHLTSELLENKIVDYYYHISELLEKIFISYYQIESPMKSFDDIVTDDIIPSVYANRESIEIKKWKK